MTVLLAASSADLGGQDELAYASIAAFALMISIGAVIRLRHHHRKWGQVALRAVRAERHRIARELHDEAGHGLFLIATHARRLPAISPATKSIAMAIDETAQATMQQIRNLVGVLRSGGPAPPPEQDRRSLSAQIVEALLLQSPSPGRARFEVNRIEREELVPRPVRRVVLSVVQEGLASELKHHPHGSVSVLIDYGRGVLVRIQGQPPQAGGSGAGVQMMPGCLAGLRERVQAEGGVLEIWQTAEEGRVLIARFPEEARHDGKEPWCASAFYS